MAKAKKRASASPLALAGITMRGVRKINNLQRPTMNPIYVEGIRSWIDDDDGKLYASDGNRRFYVHLKLYGDPRFVVRAKSGVIYDGRDIADAVKAFNDYR